MVPRFSNQKWFDSRLALLVAAVFMLGVVPAVHADTAVTFPDDAPETYVRGSGQDLAFDVDGQIPQDGDVLVLAWSDDEQRMVDEFAHTVQSTPHVIAADQMDLLPDGRVQLQLMRRFPDEARTIARRWVEVVQPTRVETLPAVSFADDALTEYVRGSGATLPLAFDGPMPADADVLVIAWSDGERRMVSEFAHTLDAAPWEISAAKLDTLPTGRVNVQLQARYNGEKTRADRWIEVAAGMPELSFVDAPASYRLGSGVTLGYEASKPAPEGSTLTATASNNGETVAGFTHELETPAGQISSDRLDTLPLGDVTVRLTLSVPDRDDVSVAHTMSVQPAPTMDPAPVSFGDDAPTQYVQGSGVAIPFNLEGELPDGGDVLVIAWSDSEQRMVDEFAHTLTAEPWQVSAAQMDKLPAGGVSLQLLSRYDGDTVRDDQWIEVVPALPQISISSQPATYQIGSGDTIGYQVNGDMPDGSTLMASAQQNGAPVSAFAHELPASSGAIASAMLDMLPAGDVRLTLTLNVPERDDVSVSRTLSVQAAAEPDPDPEPVVMPEIRFSVGTPSSYQKESGETIEFVVDGELPDGGDVLAIAWSDGEQRMVDEYAHKMTSEPWVITSDKLDLLPTGGNSVQLLLRAPDQESVQISTWLTVEAAAGDGDTGDDGSGDGDSGDDDSGDGSTGGGDDGSGDGDSGDDGSGDDGTDGGDSGDGSDELGWTTLTKASDTRVIYVSSSEGSDSNNGLSPEFPMRSVSRGYEALRDGSADWLCLKRGDAFDVRMPEWKKSGRSSSEPMVFTAYGSGPRPVVRPVSGKSVIRQDTSTRIDHLWIVGLKFYNVYADFNSPRYGDGSAAKNAIRGLYHIDDMLIEDCHFSFFNVHIVFQDRGSGDLARNIRVRRNVLVDAYSGGGHSQGMYLFHVGDMLIEGNMFDRNGWHPRHDGGTRTMFNHNIYLDAGSRNITIRKNILARGSNFGINIDGGGDEIHGLVIEDNVMVGNATGLEITGRGTYPHKDIEIRRNFTTRSGRELEGLGSIGHGFVLKGLDNGMVEDNLFAHKTSNDDSSHPIKIGEAENRDLTVRNNKVHRWAASGEYFKINNDNDLTFTGNLAGLDDSRYEDAQRSVTTYLEQELNMTGSLETLYQAMRQQRKGNWDRALTGNAISDWVRQGYVLVPTFD